MGHVSYSEEINATPEQVWAIISNVTRLPDWAYKERGQNYPVEGKYGSDQREGVGTIWVGVSADGQTATQKITAWEAPTSLAYQLEGMENAALKMSQTSTFTLEPADNGTKITWAVDWELGGGFSLNKLLIWFTGNAAFEEMIAGSLENLKALVEAEAGEKSPPDEAANNDDPAAG